MSISLFPEAPDASSHQNTIIRFISRGPELLISFPYVIMSHSHVIYIFLQNHTIRHQLSFLHLAAVNVFPLVWIMCLLSSHFSNIIVCSSAVSPLVHVFDWSYAVNPAPFMCMCSDLDEANLGWLDKLITSFVWPLSLTEIVRLSSPGYRKDILGMLNLLQSAGPRYLRLLL